MLHWLVSNTESLLPGPGEGTVVSSVRNMPSAPSGQQVDDVSAESESKR